MPALQTQNIDTTSRARGPEPQVEEWIIRLFGRGKPLGFQAGDANLYRYVANSPTNHSDPSGLDFGTIADSYLDSWQRLQEMLYQENGSWPAIEYFRRILPGMRSDDYRECRRGCVGLANVRLGTTYMRYPIFGNQARFFRTYAEANAYRQQLLAQQHPGGAQPRIFAVAFNKLNGINEQEFNRPNRQPQGTDVVLDGGFDFWTLHEPQGATAFWEHLNHSFSTPNPQVIHSPFDDGVNNRSGYRHMIYGVVLTCSRWMPPGPNAPANAP